MGQAYELHKEVARLRAARGERIAGYRIGCVSAAVHNRLGLDRPVFGHVFETELYSSGVILDFDAFAGPAIKGEFAMRIATDIPSADWIHDHRLEVISTAFAIIELHNYTFRNHPHTAQDLIACNAIRAGVVLPEVEPPLASLSALLDVSLEVRQNGATLGEAAGPAIPGAPLASLVRLSEHLALTGRILRRGDLVLTGSTLPLYRVEDGDTIEVLAGGVHSARASFSRRQSSRGRD